MTEQQQQPSLADAPGVPPAYLDLALTSRLGEVERQVVGERAGRLHAEDRAAAAEGQLSEYRERLEALEAVLAEMGGGMAGDDEPGAVPSAE